MLCVVRPKPNLPEEVFDRGLDLRITPIKEGSRVITDTSMAGLRQAVTDEVGEFLSVQLLPVRELELRL